MANRFRPGPRMGARHSAPAWQPRRSSAADESSSATTPSRAPGATATTPPAPMSPKQGRRSCALATRAPSAAFAGGSTSRRTTPGEALNAQVLEGFVAGLRASGAKDVGVYSTAPQWQRITGLSGSLGPLPADLAALPVWLPGAGSRTGAALDCSVLSFTGGPVLMTQWTTDQVDHDLRCAPLRGAAPLGP
jgi:hypothetical protein